MAVRPEVAESVERFGMIGTELDKRFKVLFCGGSIPGFLLNHGGVVEDAGFRRELFDGLRDELYRIIPAIEFEKKLRLCRIEGGGIQRKRFPGLFENKERLIGPAHVRESKRLADARLKREGTALKFMEILRGACGRFLHERGVAHLKPHFQA